MAGCYNAKRAGQRASRLRREARCARELHFKGALWPRCTRASGAVSFAGTISADLKRVYPTEPVLNASHETIYNAMYAARGGNCGAN